MSKSQPIRYKDGTLIMPGSDAYLMKEPQLGRHMKQLDQNASNLLTRYCGDKVNLPEVIRDKPVESPKSVQKLRLEQVAELKKVVPSLTPPDVRRIE